MSIQLRGRAPPLWSSFSLLFRTFAFFVCPGALFRLILGSWGNVFSFFLSISRFCRFFLAFWRPRGPSRTPKNHENHCTVIQNQGFANFKKVRFRGRFWCPWGSLWAPFWSPLRSLGLLLAPPGPPKRSQSRKKSEKIRS